MTPATEPGAIRHIVVTLDASESGRPVLETAVRLAALLGARLEGVFIEDINLIRLGGLPFLRELRFWSLAEENIDPLRLQRELRTLARRAEQMLEQAVGETGIPWSFQVWRGHAGADALAQAFAADILGLCRSATLAAARMRRPPRGSASQRVPATATINVLFSASEQAARALTTACTLARGTANALNVLLTAGTGESLQTLKDKARTILEAFALTARFMVLDNADVQSLARAVASDGICVLITETWHPLLMQNGLDRCLDALPCAVLLVR